MSGTLLGAVRDHRILPHDKDLDIGIYSSDIENIDLKRLFVNQVFEILPTRINKQIKLKHNNGTYIDIFIHDMVANIFGIIRLKLNGLILLSSL